jgi:hypothetical protein
MPLQRGKDPDVVSSNISEMVHAGHPRKVAIAAALNTARNSSRGGMPRAPVVKNDVKPFWGAISSPVAGRTDHLKMHVLSGSYVIPADIVSGMGEGNTSAGFKIAKQIFTNPEGAAPSPDNPAVAEQYGLVPVVVAGGEFVIPPWDVEWQGDGDMDDGHQVLDEYVTRSRKKLVTTLKKLPGPKAD